MILKRFNVEKVTDDPSSIAILTAEGYAPVRRRERKAPSVDYSAMKKTELEKIAKQKGVNNVRKIKKNDLVHMLEEM